MPSSQRADLSLNELLQEKAFDPDLGLVRGDAEQLWEAFLNLIRNAIEAMNTEGELTVSTKRGGPDAVVSIIDTGRGMTEEEAQRLFVPFFTTKTTGTGLGLAHTQQVVIEHGGKIQCKTAPGRGSTFTVQLPMTAREKAPTKETSLTAMGKLFLRST